MIITALGIGLSTGWMLPAQAPADPAKGPQWKDRAEYDLADAYSKAPDGKGRLAALDKWTAANSDSEMFAMRDEFYLGTYGELKENRKAFDRAKAMRAKNANNYFAITTILANIYAFTPLPPAAADLATAEETAKYVLDNGDKIFTPANKPATMADEAWAKSLPQYRPAITALALRTNAWIWVQRKDDVRAETELTKVSQSDPDQPAFSYMLGTAKFNQYLKNKTLLAKVPEAIFQFARAAVYAGPAANTVSAANKTAYLNTATSLYKQYHGSDDGFPALLALAKTSAMPPADFKILSVNEIEEAKFKNAAEYDAAHPQQTFWRDAVRTPLTGADADKLFMENYKDSSLPPGPPNSPMAMFKAKIISMTPETSPKEMTVAIFDANIPDAKLTFNPALPGTMAVGSDIEFKGTVTAFQKEPFMVTFAIDMEEKELVGWTGTGPVGKAAPKGKAKAKAAPKGKAK
ncbi:MAG: hypothetical protein ABIR70_09480 [Bryobacteraceae bacterium]